MQAELGSDVLPLELEQAPVVSESPAVKSGSNAEQPRQLVTGSDQSPQPVIGSDQPRQLVIGSKTIDDCRKYEVAPPRMGKAEQRLFMVIVPHLASFFLL